MDITQIINNLISDLTPRQKEVLEGRFGLKTGRKTTLAALGEKYELTRERVRQIEEEAIKSVAKKIKSGPAAEILAVADNELEKIGNARQEDFLVEDLKKSLKDKNLTVWHLRFLFEAAGHPYYRIEDKNFRSFWYKDKTIFKKISNFIDKLAKFLSNKKEDLITHKKFDKLFAEAVKSNGLRDTIALNYISISKKFGTNSYGDFGLSHWEEIVPKTMRAKAYLVLKKYQKPMHFRHITEEINKVKFDKRAALPQTIHNELIKDPQFILVGRGMYGLKEFGLMPGTAKEVIANLLKTKGPLLPSDVIDLTLQQRVLKKGTILLNLSNKKHFKKLPEGKYYLA